MTSHLRQALVASTAVALLGLAPAAIGTSASAAPAVAAADEAAPVTVGGLTTNGRTNPLGIPGRAPSLGWKATSPARDVVQSAYQVEVAQAQPDGATSVVWDSGKVESDRQVDVAYEGPELASATRYLWRVRTWDGDDVASEWSRAGWFETGLLDADDWDAEWIGEGADTEIERWTDYTVSVDFRLTNLALGVFFRGETPGDSYMWQVTVADGTPRLKVHRRSGGGYTVLENKDISSAITVEELLEADHTLDVSAVGSEVVTSLDGEEIDRRTDDTHPRGYVGLRTGQATEGAESARVRSVTVTDTEGAALLEETFDDGDHPFSAGTVEDGDLVLSGETEAWYSPSTGAPLLRTEFAVDPDKEVASARVHATARGVYELRLNGEKVGDQHLAPGTTDYPQRIQHQSYDVTDQLTAGDNALAAEIGDGWYAGRNYHIGPGYYGDETSLLAQLDVTYTDGTTETVGTGEGWTSHEGPYVMSDNIDGEEYDARLEQPGFDTAGFDDADWQPVMVRDDGAEATATVVPQPDEPVRTVRELDVVERTEPTPGAHVYDLGQNMVGSVRVRLTGEAGDRVRLRFAEELVRQGPDTGQMYTANLRSARATDYYTFAEDGTVVYEPAFTFHGYRYLEVTGVDEAPANEDVTGVVWASDLPETGTLETGDEMLDQLVSNITWGMRGNFLSIPTDTPARDERLGWTGDINVFGPTASYLTDTRAFLGKWMDDLRDSQLPTGGYPAIAPNFGFGPGGTAWEDAGVTVPYAVWQAYGDTDLLRRNWESMTRFMEYNAESAGADLLDDGRNVYGDWLHLDDATPVGVLGTAYFAENSRMMSEMAAALGEDEQAEAYAAQSEAVRAAFAEAYVAADGTVTGNSQTGYAMALGMDLVTDDQREAVGRQFVAKLESRDMHLSTGFVGTPWLLPALSSIDRDDLAWRLLTNRTYPSWGYEIENGATTVWERWNSIMPDGSFGEVSMNSFNHYAYGAVGDWMARNIGAIAPAEPGYRSTRIRPVPGGGLTSSAGSLESAYGTIATQWSSGEQGAMQVDATVPVGTTAEVVLPAATAWAVTESGVLAADAEGVHGVTAEDDEVVVTVGSGDYSFEVRPGAAGIGAVLDALVGTTDHVEGLLGAGDLAGDDADALDTGLVAAYDDVLLALRAELDDDDAAAREQGLRDGLADVRDLRAWLADSSVDSPVAGDLDGRLARIETMLERLVAGGLGVSVALPPVGDAIAGQEATGTLEVVNTGSVAVEEVAATVTVLDQEIDVVGGPVEPGATAQLPVTVDVPSDTAPGSYDASAEAVLTRGDESLRVVEETPDWLVVGSGLTIGEAVLTPAEGAAATERAVLSVPVANAGETDVHGHVAAVVPAGWGTVPSAPVAVPAGGEEVIEVPVAMDASRIDGQAEVGLEVRDAGVVLATAKREVATTLSVPPTEAVLDHVDFGDGASEQEHGVVGSPSSGTNTEAGLTRRYAHSQYPGSWFSAELDVTAGEPFVVRGLETFNGALTKRYQVLVDGTPVATQTVPRTVGGDGTITWDLLVDDPAVLDNDGSVELRFQYPEDPGTAYDPSLADVWTLEANGDLLAPVTGAAVVSGPRGSGGWYRGDVTVDVAAADGRPGQVQRQAGFDAGWTTVTGPVPVTGEGSHTMSYRATDEASNRSPGSELVVGIDPTPPETALAVARDPDRSDRATVELDAGDATSGVAVTRYRVDEGTWQVADGPVGLSGYGDHVVEYRSVDVAGNAEPLRRTTVTLADVDRLVATAPPQVLGTPRIGQRLRATPGSWNTDGVEVAYQWLRGGRPIAGATGQALRVGRADLGSRLSVRVTASKPGLGTARAASTWTPSVGRALAEVTVSPARSVVPAGGTVRTVVQVTSAGVRPFGRVRLRIDGRPVATVVLRNGRAVAQVRVPRGRHQLSARYLGSPVVDPRLSPSVVVRGR